MDTKKNKTSVSIVVESHFVESAASPRPPLVESGFRGAGDTAGRSMK